MKTQIIGLLLAVAASIAVADDAKEEAVKKDRQRIAGSWRVVELVVDGKPADEADARKLTVVNGSDGTWSLRSEGNEISRGTSTFDPTQKPKHIDFTPTIGDVKDKLHLGIYELGDDVRKLCFAPAGEDRPTEFSSESGSGNILVRFERVQTE